MLNVCSVSGGKDSTALYLWMLEQGLDFKAVFSDTGHEHPVTVNYVKYLDSLGLGPKIHTVKRDFSKELKKKGLESTGTPFLDMLLVQTMMPSGNKQFCTTLLKLEPIRDWINEIRKEDELTLYLGIRAQESLKRSKLPEKEFSDYYDGHVHRPLLKWLTEDVFSILTRHKVDKNPLYDAGMTRVGCYPCINTNKGELALLPDWVWDKIKDWEKRARVQWFKPFLVPGLARCSVEDVRKWCKTKRGGHKEDPMAPDANDVPTCMSTWGVCS